MGRLIDADRLKAHYCWWSGGTKEMTIDEAKKIFDTIIDVQPTVDAVEVVRCKDCDYHFEQPRGFSPICQLTRSRAEKEGFCSWGKKKDE